MSSRKITNMMKNVVYICSGTVLVYLLSVSILSTCVIGTNVTEGVHTFYVKDYPIIHSMSVFILMGLIYWLRSPVGGQTDEAV